MMDNEAAEGPIQQDAADALRKRIVRAATTLFGVAAFALVAIAATIGGTYYARERTTGVVDKSREVARLARTAYALTV